MFAGSILDLDSNTAYEARFVLSDPDGVSGPAANATKTVTVRTRPEPMPWQGSSANEGGKVYHVYPAIFSVNTLTSYGSSDYNGFRPNPTAAASFQWNVGPPPAPGSAGIRGFATLAEYAKATGQNQHSLMLDYDVFVNVPKLDRDPKMVQRLYDFKNFDFRLKPGAVAIDRGVALPNINDTFAGKAPDLGAFKAGQPLPIYSPRR